MALRAMASDQAGGGLLGGIGESEESTPAAWGYGFMVNGVRSLADDLLSPEPFGHGGAGGCTLQVDPVADVTVAFASNALANLGFDAFPQRLARVATVTVACATQA